MKFGCDSAQKSGDDVRMVAVMLVMLAVSDVPPPMLPADGSKVSTGQGLTDATASALLEQELADGRLRRVAFSFGLSLPGVAGVAGVIFGAAQHSRSWSGLDGVGFSILWFLGASAVSLLIPFGAAAGFHAADGVTSTGWAFLGHLGGFVVASAFMLASLAVQGATKIPFYCLAGLAGSLGPTIALEARNGSTARAQLEQKLEKERGEWSAGLVPVNGGAMLAVGRAF